MTKTTEEAQDALEETGAAVALALTGLVNGMLAGKKRVVVVSEPEWFARPMPGANPLIGYRHTIEVEDLTPPA